MRRDFRPFRFRLAAFLLALAWCLCAGAESAGAGIGPQPYYAPPPPGYYYAPPPGYAVPPRPPRVFACDGSEPLLGGILGAAAGGVLGSALGQHHGRIDPGATLFGMFAGAMLGAAIASSGCP